VRPLEEYIREYVRVGPERFRKQHTSHLLVSRADFGEDGDREFNTVATGIRRTMRPEAMRNTLEAGSQEHLLHLAEPELVEARAVLEIVKRPGGPFSERISVGRTRASDMHLPLTKISKFHAYFTVSEGAPIMLADAGSTNGTFLDGEKLPPKQPMEVDDGAVIRFGPYTFELYSPDRFGEFLEKLTEPSP